MVEIFTLAQEGDAHHLLYKGKPLRTPGGNALVIPHAALADAVLEEWRAQAFPKIKKETMPLYGLTCLALDHCGPEREKCEKQLVAYTETELLAHRATEPPELVQLQAKKWNPLLEWIKNNHHFNFTLAMGIMPVTQDPQLPELAAAYIQKQGLFALAGIFRSISVSGSFVLGLALAEGYLSPEEIHALSNLDELFQREKWGADEAATERLEMALAEMQLLQRYFLLLLKRQ